MPSHISDHEFGQAIVDSVCNGSYPESEEVVSAELPQSALPTILKLIDQAREDVKVNDAFP
jgi:protein transport protein DSL1/ZW10